MIKLKNDVHCSSVWDDKMNKRYLFNKEWDKEKPQALVISKASGIDDGIIQTLTQLIITNNLPALGFGGFTLCNLIPSIGGKETDEANMKFIESEIKSSKHSSVILCWGSSEKFPEYLQDEIVAIIELLKKHSKKAYRISDGETDNFTHPLSPKVRAKFRLSEVELS